MKTINEGQIWDYRRLGRSRSFLIIRKIEKNKAEEIVHVSVKNITIGGESWDITHIPIEREILIKSLTKQRKASFVETDDEFYEAYNTWKSQNGGVWSIPLDQVIQTTVSAVRDQKS
jgi:hypothetical protein